MPGTNGQQNDLETTNLEKSVEMCSRFSTHLCKFRFLVLRFTAFAFALALYIK